MQLKEVEKKVITLVESRGVAAFPYRKNISNIIEYINKEFSNGNTEFTIPKKLTVGIDFIDDLEIKILINNNEQAEFSSGGGNAVINNQQTLNEFGKLPRVDIEINGFSYKGILYQRTLTNSLYHELNHVYQAFIELKKYGGRINTTNLYYDIQKLRSESEVNNLTSNSQVNNILNMVIYRLFIDTELNALISGVYGTLDAIDSKRENFKEDIKQTQAYYVYYQLNKIKYELINYLTEEQLRDFYLILRKNGININSYNNSIHAIKRAIYQKINFNLKRLIKGIGSTASLYYDHAEEVNEIKNNHKKNIVDINKNDIIKY